ncbi:hypothetical protein C7B82_30090 [Stenomitos frigidus ULC18]|uniref:Uncharacterized protein n=1 Tax=Stenomitos frigidus ULC18 TaxID=2107698 RepID=A0A2T1DTI1_9CYAN|nr:hypothetical protein C7B82_30090 [Stenomitos frigidus ULC18]
MTVARAIARGDTSLFRGNTEIAFGALCVFGTLLFGIVLLITSEMGRLTPTTPTGLLASAASYGQ